MTSGGGGRAGAPTTGDAVAMPAAAWERPRDRERIAFFCEEGESNEIFLWATTRREFVAGGFLGDVACSCPGSQFGDVAQPENLG